MRVWISTDEMYPVRRLHTEEHPCSVPVDLSHDRWRRVQLAWNEWEACQRLLAEVLEEAKR